MKEIKFRVWNEAEDMMIFCDFNSRIKYLLSDLYAKGFVMLYTGCKDKTGKEIYEGDILRQIYKGHEIIAPMIWNQNKCQFGMDAIVDFESPDHLEIDIPENEVPEVIGNIYENPELLKS